VICCLNIRDFLKQKTNKNWEAYRKQRNFVNKLKKKSVHKYFYERCAGGPKSSDFWPTIKPFAEMPSKPVAFFILNLFICLSTKVGVTGLNVKVSVFVLCQTN
jgi:hypothetical protein